MNLTFLIEVLTFAPLGGNDIFSAKLGCLFSLSSLWFDIWSDMNVFDKKYINNLLFMRYVYMMYIKVQINKEIKWKL